MLTVRPGAGASPAAKAKAAPTAGRDAQDQKKEWKNSAADKAVKWSKQQGNEEKGWEDNKWSANKSGWQASGSSEKQPKAAPTLPTRIPAPKVAGFQAGVQPAKFVPAAVAPKLGQAAALAATSTLLGGPPKVGKAALAAVNALRPILRPVSKGGVIGGGKAPGAQVVPPRSESSPSGSSLQPQSLGGSFVRPMPKVGGMRPPGMVSAMVAAAAAGATSPMAKTPAGIPSPMITGALMKILQPAGLAHVIVALTKLGVESASDLHYVTDDDLQGMQLSVIQRRKFREIADSHGGKDTKKKGKGKGKGKDGSAKSGDDKGDKGGKAGKGKAAKAEENDAADEPAWKKGKSSNATYWKSGKKDWDWNKSNDSGDGGSSWKDDSNSGDSSSWKGNNKRKKNW